MTLSSVLSSVAIIGAVLTVADVRAEPVSPSGDVQLVLADLGKPPLPAANPLRGLRRSSPPSSVVDAGPADAAAAADQLAETLPPLPEQNPLRGLRSNHGLARTTDSSHQIAPARPAAAAADAHPVYAIAPLLNYDVSAQDLASLRQSVEHAVKGRFGEAAATRRRINDPVARKLALWYALRKNDEHPDPLELNQFRNDNPDWPSNSLMRRMGELTLFNAKADAQTVIAFYAKAMPTSGLGRFLLARAWKQTGKTTAAVKLARDAWRSESFGPQSEGEFLDEFGADLGVVDHLRRADYFLYKDRKQLLSSVERVLKYLDKDDQRRVKLRMDVAKRRLSAAEKEYAKLGDAALKDPGLLMSRIQLARRKKDFESAWRLLDRAPQDAKSMGSPAAWWTERRLATRIALTEGKPQTAYRIASRHGEIGGDDLVEAEFLAGWIALSRLKDPALAERHFSTMQKAAAEDQDQAKAAYWLGRSRVARRDKIGALAHFSQAAKFKYHFYGQLALQRLDANGLTVQEQPDTPSAEDTRTFLARDAVRALIISHKAQLEGVTPLFFSQLAWRLKSSGEMTLLAELASQIRSQHGSVLTGKVGIHRGFALDRYAYPINALPAYDRLTAEVEKSLLLALARQESEFNAEARSPAGARGMMQIMPGTAKMIARQHGVSYSRDRLNTDPTYNVTLGVAHIHDLIQQYNGSYILTLVAYNAGPGRARQWIEAFGDPRARDVDAIDWVESIPFTETRRYVQRILASAQLFRHRLRGGKGAIRLVQDLERGTPEAPMRKASAEALLQAVSSAED